MLLDAELGTENLMATPGVTALLPPCRDELPVLVVLLELEDEALGLDRVVLKIVSEERYLRAVQADLALETAEILARQRFRIALPLLVNGVGVRSELVHLEPAAARSQLRRSRPVRVRGGGATRDEQEHRDHDDEAEHAAIIARPCEELMSDTLLSITFRR